MKPVDMNAADRNAEYLGIPGLSLMENAGRVIAEEVRGVTSGGRVAVFCGPGGNGGDGFVAARHLLNMGFDVDVYLLAHPSRIRSGDALQNLRVLEAMQPHPGGFNIIMINDSSDIPEVDADVIVDAILGTGVHGRIREPYRSAIKVINRADSFRVSVDVPSGLNPADGTVEDVAVSADLTVTFHRMKDGLREADPAVTGEVVVADIGIPGAAEVFLGPGDLLRLPSRDPGSHKGENGRVLVVGGSRYYSGAPALAGLSALRVGADLVTVACPTRAAAALRSTSPDLIVRELEGDHISLGAVDEIMELAEASDSVLMGCGAGTDPETGEAFLRIIGELEGTGKPLVLDADALKLVHASDVAGYRELVVTPHMGEFRKFFSLKSEIYGDMNERITAFQSVSSRIRGTVLLKGRTDIILQEGRVRLNRTGCPAMTVGGTGDCLAGVTVGLMAMGLSPFDSAALASFINGSAGEIAADRYGDGLKASDILEFIPRAMKMESYGL